MKTSINKIYNKNITNNKTSRFQLTQDSCKLQLLTPHSRNILNPF